MEGRKISFVVLAMAGLLTACGSRVWGDDSEISTALAFGEAEECTQNAKTREDTIVKISDCLSEQVPEIDDWAAYVDLKSDGQAYLYQTYDLETEEVYKDVLFRSCERDVGGSQCELEHVLCECQF